MKNTHILLQVSYLFQLSDIERCEEYASVITRLLAYAKMHVNTQIQSLVSFCIKLSKRDSTAQVGFDLLVILKFSIFFIRNIVVFCME